MQDGETVVWKASVKRLVYVKLHLEFERSFHPGIYFGLTVLHVHHGQQCADDSSSCQHLGGGRKPCDSHSTTQGKQRHV